MPLGCKARKVGCPARDKGIPVLETGINGNAHPTGKPVNTGASEETQSHGLGEEALVRAPRLGARKATAEDATLAAS